MNSSSRLFLCKKRAMVSSSVIKIKHAVQTDQSHYNHHAHHFATFSGYCAVPLSRTIHPLSSSNRILIQSRGIRHKTSPEERRSYPITFIKGMLFKAFFHICLLCKQMVDPNGIRSKESIDEFVMRFNQENFYKGLKIEREERSKKIFFKLVLLCLCLASAFVFTLVFIISPDRDVISAHKVIMKQPPITLDQLIHHLGKVQVLTYYPTQNKVVAELHADAIVDGQQQQANDLGVNVHLDEAFRCDSQLFPKRIQEEENQLGIEPISLAIHGDDQYIKFIIQRILFLLLIGLPLCWLIVSRYMRRLRMNEFFRVVYIGSLHRCVNYEHSTVLLEARRPLSKNHILIHSRGIRHKIGAGEENDELHPHDLANHPNKEKLFKIFFHMCLTQKKRENPNNFRSMEYIEEFIKEYNEKNVNVGLKIERIENTNKIRLKFALCCIFLASAFVFTLMAIISPDRGVLSEHRAILKQPPITLHQLIHHLREVHVLTYYPTENKVVAKLIIDAINGGRKQFNDLDLNVLLDEAFRCDPLLFPKRIHEEENRLGIEPISLAIHGDYPYTKLQRLMFFLIIGLPLCWFIVNRYLNWLWFNEFFRVVPTTTSRPSRRTH